MYQFNKCKRKKNSFAQLLLASRTSGLKIGSCKHFLFHKLRYSFDLDVVLQWFKMLEGERNRCIIFYHNMKFWVENNLSCLYLGIK